MYVDRCVCLPLPASPPGSMVVARMRVCPAHVYSSYWSPSTSTISSSESGWPWNPEIAITMPANGLAPIGAIWYGYHPQTKSWKDIIFKGHCISMNSPGLGDIHVHVYILQVTGPSPSQALIFCLRSVKSYFNNDLLSMRQLQINGSGIQIKTQNLLKKIHLKLSAIKWFGQKAYPILQTQTKSWKDIFWCHCMLINSLRPEDKYMPQWTGLSQSQALAYCLCGVNETITTKHQWNSNQNVISSKKCN